MGLGRCLPPLRRRQDDHPVAVHGEHGDAGHHVLEAAIGLAPADALAELSRQGSAGGLRIGGDQGAQQRHFLGAEVAPVVSALDRAGHPGDCELRACAPRSSSRAARATGRPAAWRPFSAHAVSHASSHRRTSMPFTESVPTTEYMIAVNRAPSSLSDPKRQPPSYCGRTQGSLGFVVVQGHLRLVDEDAQPLAMVEKGAQRPGLACMVGQGRPVPLRPARTGARLPSSARASPS